MNILTQENFEQITSTGVHLVDFATQQCTACKVVDALLPELEKRFTGRASVSKVRADDASDLIQQFSVFSFPTVLIIKDGDIVHRIKGTQHKDLYEESLQYRIDHSLPNNTNDDPLYDISNL